MQTVDEVLDALKSKGSQQTCKTYRRHGAPDNMYGVKVADLKIIARQIKGNQALALELYQTGNCDAMYLAGMVADGRQMSKRLLNEWARSAPWHMIAEYTVPWVTVESPFAVELALKWIKGRNASVASTGWCTYSGIVATVEDDELDLAQIQELLQLVADGIERAEDRVRYTMNGFVISVGGYVKPLNRQATSVARRLGKVEVDMGETACQVPVALDYIAKMQKAGRAFKKRKTIRC